jgi:hypothetical protein
MKTSQFTPVLILAILIFCNSFAPSQKNSIARGGGIADGIHFDFNAVKQKDGSVTGYVQFGDERYTLECGTWFENAAILYTTDGHAFCVTDNGEGKTVTDWISEPNLGECGDNWLAPVDFLYSQHNVTDGTIQVK